MLLGREVTERKTGIIVVKRLGFDITFNADSYDNSGWGV